MFDFNGFIGNLPNHEHGPQRAALATRAMEQIQAALGTLAGLGYQFDVMQLAQHPTEVPKEPLAAAKSK